MNKRRKRYDCNRPKDEVSESDDIFKLDDIKLDDILLDDIIFDNLLLDKLDLDILSDELDLNFDIEDLEF